MQGSNMSAALGIAIGLLAVPPSEAGLVKAIEYAGDHMFLTANPAEIAALDSGATPGWKRTGVELWVHDSPAVDLVPVCRFYSAAFAPRSSHFYTADAAECAAVKASPDWVYEGVAFYASLPGQYHGCAGAGSQSVERWYNAGRGGAPNHLYQPYLNVAGHHQRMSGLGWRFEGIAFCMYGQWPPVWDPSMPQSGAKGLLTGSRWRIVADVAPGDLPLPELVLAIEAVDPSGRLLATLEFTRPDGRRHKLATETIESQQASYFRGDEFVYVQDLYGSSLDDAVPSEWTLWAQVEFVLTGRDEIAVCVAMRQIDWTGGFGQTYSLCPAMGTRM